MQEEAIERLQTKTATEALVERVQQDFNLSPVVAPLALAGVVGGSETEG